MSVKSLFDAIGTCCQGNREVCAPGYLMVEKAFYNAQCPQLPGNNQEIHYPIEMYGPGHSLSTDLVKTVKHQWLDLGQYSHFNADSSSVRNLKFKIGYPYLMRHSALTQTSTGPHREIACCDHIFMFSDLRMASWPQDASLVDPECSILPVLDQETESLAESEEHQREHGIT